MGRKTGWQSGRKVVEERRVITEAKPADERRWAHGRKITKSKQQGSRRQENARVELKDQTYRA